MNNLVTIIVPAYNAGPWIEATLTSALAQSHRCCEIVVIDDGSTDDTLVRAQGLATAHPKSIRVETQSNAGAAAARNHGMRLARGQYLQFLDADDLLSPRKIELQLAALDGRGHHYLATCRWGRFEDSLHSVQFADSHVFHDFSPLEWMLLHCGQGAMLHPAVWLVPRALADRAGPWNESLSLNDDGEYFARVVLASAGLTFCTDDAATSFYRSGIQTSLSRQRSRKALESLRQSIELISDQVSRYAAIPGAAPDQTNTHVQTALADYWQRLAYELYPDDVIGSCAASRRARKHGGSHLAPPMGRRLRWLAQVFGWRIAYRLQRFRR
jgi:glycosyltransferase involved in cell wall biosynthesis